MRIPILLTVLAGLSAVSSLMAGNRPSFIFILTDDQGWSQSSVEMHPKIARSKSDYLETPAMARLAREGMRFSSGYASAPTCTPTRRSLLCGMTPARQRGSEFRSEFDPEEHLTIPRALKAVDPSYRTAHFGKWGMAMGVWPSGAGFDESDGRTTSGVGGLGSKSKDKDEPLWVADPDPKRTASVTLRAIDFIKRQTAEKRPFFLQVSYYALHMQIQATEETLAKYEKKGQPPRSFPSAYAAMAEEMDRGIGRILAVVDDLGIDDSTYVFLSSDNGGNEFDKKNPAFLKQIGDVAPGLLKSEPWAFVSPKGSRAANDPLRGAKQWLYEGGIRVPMIVRGPGVEPGSWSHVPVVLYDLLPTLADLAGGEDPLPAEIDGGSLRTLLQNGGKGEVRRAAGGIVFHRPRNGYSAFRAGSYKLVIRWMGSGGKIDRELFDVHRDPGEWKDLAGSDPTTTRLLYEKLISYLVSVDAVLPDYVRMDAQRKHPPPDPG